MVTWQTYALSKHFCTTKNPRVAIGMFSGPTLKDQKLISEHAWALLGLDRSGIHGGRPWQAHVIEYYLVSCVHMNSLKVVWNSFCLHKAATNTHDCSSKRCTRILLVEHVCRMWACSPFWWMCLYVFNVITSLVDCTFDFVWRCRLCFVHLIIIMWKWFHLVEGLTGD